ncbi:protoporphyrinogen oxidase [Rhodohalobacter halophilus]|uniref:protoporphyrinogen oxidase n=1 Tax=Rhodohalobacter halophilus TaxID=1812810 RepID=UPI00083FADC6|nr:protoporphyrinogen oxidase [Rhodohalobacter halophilus]
MSSKNSKIAVVGAGITGLVTAWKLQNKGAKVEIFERKAEAGGAIKTVRNDQWQAEYGPNTLLLKDRQVAEFLTEVGLSGDKVTANPEAEKRFIVKNGHLEPLPSSLMSAVKTPLFSITGKLRVLLEPFIPRNSDRDQTVAEFVERRLGSDILDYALNPFVAGIYANRPEDLSLRHAFPLMDNLEQEYGSMIWGAIAGSKKRNEQGRIDRELISFKNGLQQLPNSIASELNHVHLNHEVHSVRESNGQWTLKTNMGEFGPYDEVVMNTPLYKLNKQLVPITDAQLQTLQNVKYPPLSVMLLGFKKEDVDHPLDGFGFLVPEAENRKILGALFSSTLFENRAPEDSHLLTVFIGGGRQPDLAENDSETLLTIVLDELNDLIGLNGDPQFKDHIYWPKSIPAYHVGYDEVLDVLNEIESQNRGLNMAGNFRYGISVPDCIKNGLSLAEKLL